MTDDQQIRALLDELAADAPAADGAIPADRLLPRIRRRRRLRTVVPVCAAIAVAGVTAAMFATSPGGREVPSAGPPELPAGTSDVPALPGLPTTLPELPADATAAPNSPRPPNSPPDTPPVDVVPGGPLGSCGEPLSVPRGSATLRLTLKMPASLTAGGSAPATLIVTNTSTRAVRGITVVAPQVVLASDGSVVAMPPGSRDFAQRVDIAPGGSARLPVRIYSEHCIPAGGGSEASGKLPVPPPPGHPLAPGTYQAYAVVSVQPSAGGEPVTAIGGPWPVRLS